MLIGKKRDAMDKLSIANPRAGSDLLLKAEPTLIKGSTSSTLAAAQLKQETISRICREKESYSFKDQDWVHHY